LAEVNGAEAGGGSRHRCFDGGTVGLARFGGVVEHDKSLGLGVEGPDELEGGGQVEILDHAGDAGRALLVEMVNSAEDDRNAWKEAFALPQAQLVRVVVDRDDHSGVAHL